ncbi:cyclin-dependent kinase 14-like isoform X2 [Watersipora subatra]|uniref:cyclin-dependent kinase 14-like isoform X2 n=1 Tax=Watersipora subatra TaxID=2589382 RepID=UPI00355C7945
MAIVERYPQMSHLPNRSASHVELMVTTPEEEMDTTTSMTTARSEHNLASKRIHLSHSISQPASSAGALSAAYPHNKPEAVDKSSSHHLGSRFAKLKRRISRSLNKLTLSREDVSRTKRGKADSQSIETSKQMSCSGELFTGPRSADATVSHSHVSFNMDATSGTMATSDNHLHASQEGQLTDKNGVKRHYSTGDMLNERTDLDTSRPKSEGFNQSLYRAQQNRKRYSFGFDSPFGKVSAYEKLEQLGEGSYATVYKGISKLTQQIVALKETRLKEEEGAPFTAIREASLLKDLRHTNIVTLHDIVHTKDTLTFVFEYVQTDLNQYNERHPGGLHSHNVKIFLFQLLRGLAFCHDKRILHRDLKPQNLLISEIGELKLADFGLARAKSIPSKTYSNEVVTLWYRPPDVLLGSTTYSASLDMWGVGCIFLEMISGVAAFQGMKDAYDQMEKIFRVLGTPTNSDWPQVESLPNYKAATMQRFSSRSLVSIVPRLAAIKHTADLASKIIQLNPEKRIGAAEAMKHAYFADLPEAVHLLKPNQPVVGVRGCELVQETFNKRTSIRTNPKAIPHSASALV